MGVTGGTDGGRKADICTGVGAGGGARARI